MYKTLDEISLNIKKINTITWLEFSYGTCDLFEMKIFQQYLCMVLIT